MKIDISFTVASNPLGNRHSSSTDPESCRLPAARRCHFQMPPFNSRLYKRTKTNRGKKKKQTKQNQRRVSLILLPGEIVGPHIFTLVLHPLPSPSFFSFFIVITQSPLRSEQRIQYSRYEIPFAILHLKHYVLWYDGIPDSLFPLSSSCCSASQAATSATPADLAQPPSHCFSHIANQLLLDCLSVSYNA